MVEDDFWHDISYFQLFFRFVLIVSLRRRSAARREYTTTCACKCYAHSVKMQTPATVSFVLVHGSGVEMDRHR